MLGARLTDEGKRLRFDSSRVERLTHYLFRYPAKFHPPVVRTLIKEFSRHGDYIYDPFCGSGTMLVEAAIAGRNATGSDVDPLAAFVSRVKTHRFNPSHLAASSRRLLSTLNRLRRSDQDYLTMRFEDISRTELYDTVAGEDLWVPEIPNLFHWFRNYVIVDLARLYRAIDESHTPKTHKAFFRLCFASIIRASSNADPVPVSGLEVTSHMKRREKEGRKIDPFSLFERSMKQSLVGVNEFSRKIDRTSSVMVTRADARELGNRFQRSFDAIITSPPYHSAVDYYRRHQLEMFWLSFTKTQDERLGILRGYVGRSSVPRSDVYLNREHSLGKLASEWEMKMRAISSARANAFRHYAASMAVVFCQLSRVLKSDKPLVVVVGNSKWNGAEIPTAELCAELAYPSFVISDNFWYPVKNRYMSYARKNGASIDLEHVLVMHKTNARPSVTCSK